MKDNFGGINVMLGVNLNYYYWVSFEESVEGISVDNTDWQSPMVFGLGLQLEGPSPLPCILLLKKIVSFVYCNVMPITRIIYVQEVLVAIHWEHLQEISSCSLWLTGCSATGVGIDDIVLYYIVFLLLRKLLTPHSFCKRNFHQ